MQKEPTKNLDTVELQWFEHLWDHENTVQLQWLEHWWLVYYGCFELDLESLGIILWLQIKDNLVWFFFFILKTVYCVYTLGSPQWGDSNENTQNAFMLKKIEIISYYASLPGAMINTH